MGAAQKIDRPMTVEEFLEWDSGDDLTWELIDGYPRLKYPVNPEGHAAPTDNHQTIIQNISFAVDTVLRRERRPCRVIANINQRVPRRPNRTRVPDLAVKCGRTMRDARDPILIVEVLSPSNRPAEILERDADFRSIPTVVEIVFLDQDRAAATVHRRRGEFWANDRVEGIDAVLVLESVPVEMRLHDVYLGVLTDYGDDAPDA